MNPSVLALLVLLAAAPNGAVGGGGGGNGDCRACHSEVVPTHVDARRGPVACSACHELHGESPPVAGGAAGAGGGRAAPLSARCLFCHEQPHALHSAATTRPVECSTCHKLHGEADTRHGVVAGAHLDDHMAAACASCHPTVHPSHASASGFSRGCTTCHSFARDAQGPPAGDALGRACVSCHQNVAPAHGFKGHQGKRISCTDCHSMASDAALPAAAIGISRRCGACHQKELAGFLAGGHKGALDSAATNRDAPSCITCHPMRRPADARTDDVRLIATMRCVGCHSRDSLASKYGLPRGAAMSYLSDFHGATVRFRWEHPSAAGSPTVMTCSDCHGAHDVGWRKDAQVDQVCGKCHEAAGPKLAGAWPGHTPVGPNNQVAIWLVRLFYFAMIPFMLAGLFINIGFHFVDQRRKGARMFEVPGVKRLAALLKGHREPAPEMVTRFGLGERMDHAGVMTSFIVLMFTGLPQTAPRLAAARWVIDALGGIETTRLVHRTAGFVFVALMLWHVSRYVIGAIRTKRLPAMVPTKSDFREVVDTLRHYIWGAPRPRTGKFDVGQRYEYWGLMLGGTLMTATGIALVFPELVSRILPWGGQVLAVFRTLHGMEATLAVLVVAVWHVYGVMLRPEIFPLDTSIFTGRISVERLKEEHQLEYERLFPSDSAGAAVVSREEEAPTPA